MKTALLCALVPACAAYVSTTWRDLEANPSYSFVDYVREYGKRYTAEEYATREAIFQRQLAKIRQHNSNPQATWRMGLNEFTDWEDGEVHAKRTGAVRPDPSEFLGTHTMPKGAALPDTVDWRKKNVLTPVKNQGGCGSCWAFSATETLESSVAIATGKLLTLAPQQLVSCAPNPNHCGGTGGCQGSTMKLAFNYTAGAGLSLESTYPYTQKTGTCDKSKIKPAIGIKGYMAVRGNDYDALMHAVATVGPLSVMVAAGFMSYEEGIYDGQCGWEVNHGVQLVGYGSEGQMDYWIIRNSWGNKWGEQGFIRIRRFGAGKEPCGLDKTPQDGVACKDQKDPIRYCGLCAMFCSPSYPTGAHLL